MARIAASSIGSPISLPSTCSNEWQPPITAAIGAERSCTGRILSGAAGSALEAPAAAEVGALITPRAMSWSVVIVPVLSKKAWVIFPANGTRNGSVQKTCAFISAISAVLTASAVCIGSSGGTTEVMMSTQRSISSYCDFFPSSSPLCSTYPAESSAKKSSRLSSPTVSILSAVTCAVENSIMRISSPCDDEKAVASTKHTQPPSGGGGTSGQLAAAPSPSSSEAAAASECCISIVPEKSVWTRWADLMSRGAAATAGVTARASFICGTDSPVSVDSLTTAAPRSSTQSAGTRVVSLPSARVREMRSPGRRSVELTDAHAPLRKALREKALLDMPRRVSMLRCREKAVVPSKARIMKRVKRVYFQYSSSIQRTQQKSWKMAIGEESCSWYSSHSVGSGMEKELLPCSSCARAAALRSSPAAEAYSRSGRSMGHCSAPTVPTPVVGSTCTWYFCRWYVKKSAPFDAASSGTSAGFPRWR
mmetsp:Transcript_27019/g.66904  ORF Transcript_27019/g.66904 Transcript_27019/m.66904 type:complete len:478 (-) Transcript_27019:855-2288(-)